MEVKNLSEGHITQIRQLMKVINEMKVHVAEFELQKMEALTRIQQSGMEINNLISQFPALYGVPNEAQIDIDRGTISYNPESESPKAPGSPEAETSRPIHLAGDVKKE